MREIVKALLYLLRSGCQWRMMPHDLPPWQTVYYHYRKWRLHGVWQKLNRLLREPVRQDVGREATPSAAIIDWVKANFGWIWQVVKRHDDQKGFQVLPRRWVVERTFGWLNNYRRLSKDYEELPASSESLIYLAMSHIMVRRLAGTNHFER